ncbi:putative TPR domain protein [Prevotella sp. CAG:1185]|nr:putative TPR domain protein [Prevotella sp. CAG:1185]
MDSAQNNPHKREYYLKQIPFTEEQVAESNKIIEDGLFHSGIIFKDKLDNLPLSEKNLRRLTDNYPEFENMDEAYYHLYLLYSRRQDKAQANVYLDKLKQNYPESQWTVLLSDPYFKENAKFGEHIEDSLYAATYNAFKAGRYNEVSTNTALSAQRFPLGANRDKFIFIGGLSKLNSGDSNGCLTDMEEVVSKYPQSGVSPMAGMIINGVKAGRQLRGGRFDIGDVWAHRSVVLSDSDSIAARKFVAERNTDFTFMIVYSPDSLNENQLLFELARFNFSNFLVRNFDIVIDELNGLHRMKVSGFRNYDEALQYARQLYKNQKVMSIASKGRAIIISDSNIELLGTQYSYNDYDKFYEQHFVPLRISTVRLLTEPATIEFEKQPESEGGNADGLYNGGVIEEGLFINDTQPATGGTDNGISIPVEPENAPATGTQNDNTITIPVEEEKPTGNADDGGIVIPDTQQGNAAGNNNSQQNATQNDGNSFVIEPEQQTEQPATQDSQGFEINTDVYDTNANGNDRANPTPQDNNDTGITINTAEPQRQPEQTQPTRQPVQTEPKKEEPAANNDDGLIFEFGDDFNTDNGNANGSNNNNNGNVDNNKQNGYDLEDEYYDLDGF